MPRCLRVTRQALNSKSGDDASPGSGPVSLWCSTWSKILFQAVRDQAKDYRQNHATGTDVAEQPDPKRAKTQTAKTAKESKGPEEIQIQPPSDPKSWVNFLPSPTKLFSTKSLADSFLSMITTATATNIGTATSPDEAKAAETVKESVKQEASSASAQQQGGEASAKQVELLTKTPTMAGIYNMHNLAGVKNLHVLDVLAIGEQVQTHLLQKSA